MLETYKAKVRGSQITWENDAPAETKSGVEFEVEVKVLARGENGTEKRPYGLAKGEFVVPDDFDAPLPDEVLAEFEN
jgi:hypothetical protein